MSDTQPAAPSLPDVKRVRTVHLQRAKDTGEKFSMLTSYDVLTAGIFDRAGVDVLLVGDSLGNTVLGHASTLPVTVDDMVTFAAAVVRGVRRALVVVDLPFGSYEESPAQAVRSAARIMKDTGAHAVKIEAGQDLAEHMAAVVRAGIPVMGHVGFTPQSEHALGGFRIQGRGAAAEQLLRDARSAQDAGCFAVVLEMVSADAAGQVESALHIPTVGIGAGGVTTGQVLVWQDMLGLRTGTMPRFVKQYADLAGTAQDAVARYVADVRSGAFPAEEHTYRG
ncbi:3-methyl-2-oxobutanoate hydroxymethyltransferase [Kocuria rhizophila]|uniref:3-methyl-2-oxobutanoate hydroxymethyltransferase n=1 Tax=Kocuria rhizophila (strain ATCC 9341 / DSM 348 / NBRC 103217 / DC2201) TaxID=378753 RepID=B2GG07_KOCRD|nr:3-methyl-2-oxobutanoate hydroxymethyltransferase [Kocuria rhizophila]ASE10656.1 3-methyl-2-oxobutanoate hydroxymethyltransferase [Kocuria rhizophila]MBK4119683.1 3-methyl-2-oxobutanoate hydroxymethyltransferase [Kocuria rhizophila]MCC5671853.1 3-methyl-2-oxobutanoate hydroxymethyltransferase [Kocuria rhizophila]MCC5675449.1 3-methyl-2-oxobutanoate hydroxymethyltransferase [Kocuria rhizophila]MDV5999001.1 3-methyl-2-oxobutanoate hydroxymethyltransferase [Kocuria rhizophila]